MRLPGLDKNKSPKKKRSIQQKPLDASF